MVSSSHKRSCGDGTSGVTRSATAPTALSFTSSSHEPISTHHRQLSLHQRQGPTTVGRVGDHPQGRWAVHGHCPVVYRQAMNEHELGYVLAKAFWEKGNATEAARA